jgi:hypothetical protein
MRRASMSAQGALELGAAYCRHCDMRIGLAVLVAVVLALAGYALHWDRRLAPIMKTPGANLAPARLQVVPVNSVRRINLGFAEFDIPANISGEPVRHGDSLIIVLSEPSRNDKGVIIGAPLADDSPDVAKLVRDYSRFAESPTTSLFEIRKRALYVQPFSVWSVPFRGLKRTRDDSVLLMLKLVMAANAIKVQLFEGSEIDVIVTQRSDGSEILLADKRAGIEQEFWLRGNAGNVSELASALVRSYRFTATEHDNASLVALLAATGIRDAATPAEKKLDR